MRPDLTVCSAIWVSIPTQGLNVGLAQQGCPPKIMMTLRHLQCALTAPRGSFPPAREVRGARIVAWENFLGMVPARALLAWMV